MNSLKGVELADYFIGIAGRTREIADSFYDEIVDAVCRRTSGVPVDADLVIFNNSTSMFPESTESGFDARVWIYADVFEEAEGIRDVLIGALNGFNPEVLEGFASFGLMHLMFTPYALDTHSEQLGCTHREEFRRALGSGDVRPFGTPAKDGSFSRGRISDVPVRSASGSN